MIGGQWLVIPRHREVNEQTAKGIIARAAIVAKGDEVADHDDG